ncbi:MAG: helix-turn-helix domain-containing protein [Proteobacteria bacterium]|nr:helix-turn-helix domain-containing protein [Pseudomonadota bacterium]
MDELLDYLQVSEEYNVRKGTLYCWVHQKRIPHIRLGKRFVRFRRPEIEAWLKERELTRSDLNEGETP